MKLATGTPGDLCIDTDEPLDVTSCRLLRNCGVKGVFRYLSDVQPTERDTIINSGLILYFVNHARSPGWIPSAAEGAQDATRDLGDLKRLAIPVGVHVMFDLEGVGGGNPQLVMDHVNAHAAGIQATKNLEGLYVGAQALLNSAQMYSVRSTLYWHGCSRVVDMSGNEAAPLCGWAVIQLFPPNISLFGIEFDWNIIQQDYQGRVPVGIAA